MSLVVDYTSAADFILTNLCKKACKPKIYFSFKEQMFGWIYAGFSVFYYHKTFFNIKKFLEKNANLP